MIKYTKYNPKKNTAFLSDKVSRISTFISNDAFRHLEMKPETVPAGKEGTFAPIMRRDFSNMELVCRSTNCVEDSFEIPKVKSEWEVGGEKRVRNEG